MDCNVIAAGEYKVSTEILKKMFTPFMEHDAVLYRSDMIMRVEMFGEDSFIGAFMGLK
jgi:hypothetical protein